MNRKKLLRWIEKFRRKRILENIIEEETLSRHIELSEKEKEKSGLEKIIEDAKNALWNVNEFFYKHIWISAVAFQTALLWDAYVNNNYQPAINTDSIQNIDSNSSLTKTFSREKIKKDFGDVFEFYKHHFSHSATPPAENRYFQENDLTPYFPFFAGYVQRALTGAIKYASGLLGEIRESKCKNMAESASVSRVFSSKNPDLLGDFVGAISFGLCLGAYSFYSHYLKEMGYSLDWGKATVASSFFSTVAGIGTFVINGGLVQYFGKRSVFYSGHPNKDKAVPKKRNLALNFYDFIQESVENTERMPVEEIFSKYMRYLGEFEADAYEKEIGILQEFTEKKIGSKVKEPELSLLEKFKKDSDIEDVLRYWKRHKAKLAHIKQGKKPGFFDKTTYADHGSKIYKILKEHEQGKRKNFSLDDPAKLWCVELSPEEEMEFEKIKSTYANRPLAEFLPLIRTALVCCNAEKYEQAIKVWDEILNLCCVGVEKSEALCLAAKSIELSNNPKHKKWTEQKWSELVGEYKSNISFYGESKQKFEGAANIVYVAGEKLLKSTIVVKQSSDESSNTRISEEYQNLKYFSEALEDRVPRIIDLFELNGKNHLVLEHKGRNLQDILKYDDLSKEEIEDIFSETIQLLAKIHQYGRIGQINGKIRLEKQRKNAWLYEKRLETIFFDNLNTLMKNNVQSGEDFRKEFNQEKNTLPAYYRSLAREIAKIPLGFYYKDANLKNWIKTSEGIIALDFEKTTRMPAQFDLVSLLEFEPHLSSDQITHFCLLYLKSIRKEDCSVNCTEKKFLQDYQFCRTQRHLELAGYRMRDVMSHEAGISEVRFHIDSAVLSLAHLLREKNFGSYDKFHLEKFREGLMEIRESIYAVHIA